jgi:hypothetical protein
MPEESADTPAAKTRNVITRNDVEKLAASLWAP